MSGGASLIGSTMRGKIGFAARVFETLAAESSLCARPYDMCTTLVAEQAGVIVRQPDGSTFNPPLDVTTNIAFAIYANTALADRMQPIIDRALAAHL